MKKLILAVLLSPLLLQAQEKKVAPKKWTGIASAGVVVGQAGGSPVFQLSAGRNYRQLFTGIGIGYDGYELNSVPLFVDWRWKFGKRQTGFLYGMAGYHFSLKYDEPPEWAKIADKLKGGAYFDAGVGYRIPIGGFNRLSLSAGYSRKDLERKKTFAYPCATNDCPDNVFYLNYSFGRLTAKLSWELEY